MITTADVYIGMRCRSTVDAMPGIVVDVDYTAAKVRWDDGTSSIFSLKDGFVLWVPRDMKDAEGKKQ